MGEISRGGILVFRGGSHGGREDFIGRKMFLETFFRAELTGGEFSGREFSKIRYNILSKSLFGTALSLL